jgi:hypothetical protein
LVPTIHYQSPDKYHRLNITLERTPEDIYRIELFKKDIQQRYCVLSSVSDDYKAQFGDVVKMQMRGFEIAPDGVSKGAALPPIANIHGIEVGSILTLPKVRSKHHLLVL